MCSERVVSYRPFVIGALAVAMLGALGARPLAAQRALLCGVERWPVKVLMDADRDSVDHTPRPTTIAALLALPQPMVSRPRTNRLPLERWTFRVRAILAATREVPSDGDLHLVLADPADRSMVLVAEIPDSLCALGSRFASDYAEARRVVNRLPVGAEIEVVGVAFWDDEHGQLGMAENGIELHPVLLVEPVLVPARLQALSTADPGALRAISDTTGVRVWVNTSSKIYHCPGSELYGRTARGEYMPEGSAREIGARPAGGRSCSRR